MLTARELDILQVELDKQVEKLLEEFVRGHLGERMGGMVDGEEIYVDNERQHILGSEEIRDNDQPITSS